MLFCPVALSGAAVEEVPEPSPSVSGVKGAQLAADDNSAQPSASSARADAPDQAIIDVEGGVALATAWGRKIRDWEGADWADPNKTYVVKPAAVGLASVPGEFVFIVTGLPQAVVGAFSLLEQVHVSWCLSAPCPDTAMGTCAV